MPENQIYHKRLDSVFDVSNLLQTFINRGHDLKDYFLNISMCYKNGYREYNIFYDKRFEDDKPNI